MLPIPIGRFSPWRAILGGVCLFYASFLVPQAVLAQETYATYYTVKSCQREGTSGVWTASGALYDEQALTCALPHRHFGGRYQVCGKHGCAIVRHTDYGPGRGPRRKGVVIDLTPRAFLAVCGSLATGVCAVTVRGVPRHSAK